MTLKRYFLLIAFCFVPTSLFSNKLYFPEVPFGGAYTPSVVLMNMGMTSVSSDFQVYDQAGTLLRSIPTTVPAGGSTRLSITDPQPSVISSWAIFDAGAETVRGAATFDVRSTTGALIDTAGVLGVEAANDFAFPVDVAENGIASNTGFAIVSVNPKNKVTFGLQLMSESGNGSPSVTPTQDLLRSGRDIRLPSL